MIQDLEYKQFKVMQSIAIERVCRNKVYWDSSELFKRIRKPGLEDANALLRIFEKQIQENNSKLDGDEKRIRNLNYQSSSVYKSKYFKGINRSKVFKFVEENPNMDMWDMVRQFV